MENYQEQRKNRYLNFFLNIYSLYNEKVSLRKFVELLLTLVAVIVFSLFAIKPTSITIIGLVKEIDEKEKTIALLDQKIDNLRIGQAKYSQLIEFTDVFDTALASQAPAGSFVRYIEKYATQNNLTVSAKASKIGWVGNSPTVTTNLSSSKEVLGNLFKFDPSLDFFSGSVSFQGAYGDCLSFAKIISTVRTPIIFDKIVFSKGETDIVSGTMDVRIPYLKSSPESNI